MIVNYILSENIVALTNDNIVTEIPAGSVVDASSMLVAKGTIKIRYKNRQMTVLAMDLLDTAKIVPGE